MKTEIAKIIEGGLIKDSKKVYSYANHLVKKLREDGDNKFADRITKILLGGTGGTPVYKDELFNTPVDTETRLSIADILLPDKNDVNHLILSNSVTDSLNNFIEIVNNKNKFDEIGLEINSSLLLYGPPGCGKTSIAKYIANKLDLPIIIARFDSLISSLLGNTSKNIRSLFEYASSKPCILFLDEFDAIAKDRKDQQEQGELKRIINSLLQNIDQFLANNILIAATNHHELLDDAIWRRFEQVIEIERPSIDEIFYMIDNLTLNISSEIKTDKKKKQIIAKNMLKLSNSEVKKIINNTISKAIIKKTEQILIEDFLIEIYRYKKNHNINQESTIRFLHDNGVSQNSISNYYDISIRQVRNTLTQNNHDK
jgi:SpoVK/Ycf46/Vps4 family AAA+-type ATPase